MLTLVSTEDIQKAIKEKESKIESQISDSDKKLIQDNFNLRNYFQSKEQYLIMFRFQVVAKPELQALAKRLLKADFVHYDSNSGYSFHSVPSFYKSK